jgi:tetratricopeptide (TPR) repeat protein
MNVLKEYLHWIKTWKSLPVTDWIRAGIAYRKREYEQAAKLYESGLQGREDHLAGHCARLDLAHCYFRLRRFSDCELMLLECIERRKDSRLARLRLVRLYLWLGRFRCARKAIDDMDPAVVQTNVEMKRLHLYILSQSSDRSAYEAVLSEHLRSISQRGAFETVALLIQSARLNMFAEQGVFSDSVEHLLSAEDLGAEGFLLIAEFYLEQRKVFSARRVLHMALRYGIQHPHIQALLAETYLQSGTLYNAVFSVQLALDAVQRTDWSALKPMKILAEAYLHSGDQLAALAVARKAAALSERCNDRQPGIAEFIAELSENGPLLA